MSRFKRIIATIDSHTGGEPTRPVLSGLPPLHGDTLTEKMYLVRDKLDGLRALRMLERRGRQDM